MTIKDDYFRYLDHIGTSVPMRALAAHPEWTDVIALRHDIDHDLDLALEMAHHEHERGIQATYFLLHTTDYWNDPRFAQRCAQLQAYGHEIGLHLNLLTEWFQEEQRESRIIPQVSIETMCATQSQPSSRPHYATTK